MPGDVKALDELIDALTDFLVIAPDADLLREFITPEEEGLAAMPLDEFLDTARQMLAAAREARRRDA